MLLNYFARMSKPTFSVLVLRLKRSTTSMTISKVKHTWLRVYGVGGGLGLRLRVGKKIKPFRAWRGLEIGWRVDGDGWKTKYTGKPYGNRVRAVSSTRSAPLDDAPYGCAGDGRARAPERSARRSSRLLHLRAYRLRLPVPVAYLGLRLDGKGHVRLSSRHDELEGSFVLPNVLEL